MRFTNQVDISRPIEAVFEYLVDFENIPAWNYAIAQTEKTSQGPVSVGATYRQRRTLPSPSEEYFEVSAFDPPRHVAIRGELGPFDAEMEYILEPHPIGIRLTNDVTLRPRRLAGTLGRLASSRIKASVAENLNELKRILES